MHSTSIVHSGRPSGVDNACAVHGGAFLFSRGMRENESNKYSHYARVPQCRLLVTNTKVSRSTKALVEGVGKFARDSPLEFSRLLSDSTALTARLHALLQDGSTEKVIYEAATQVFPAVQGLLRRINVSHSAIEDVITECKRVSWPCKLTGAGGGGCVITIVPPDALENDVQRLQQRLNRAGFEAFVARWGEHGVSVTTC